MGNLGTVLLVDDQAAPLVNLETDVVKSETGSVRTATDGDKDDISIELCLLAMN
jgi:hypothetical protein